MNREDHELDKLLKSVKVPENLHQRLKVLTIHNNAPEKGSFDDLAELVPAKDIQLAPGKLSHTSRWWLAMAATFLIGIVGLRFWLTQPESNSGIGSSLANDSSLKIEERRDQRLEVEDANSKKSLKATIALCDQQMQELEQQMMAIRNQKIRGQVVLAENQWSVKKAAADFESQRPSLVLALSAECASRSGLANDKTKMELQRVIERFPNTLGAEHASQLLSQLN